MVATKYEISEVWEFLREVPDPEIPLVNIVGMGIVRDVYLKEDTLVVNITTTYSGCPAMKEIEESVHKKLQEKNIQSFEVNTILSPPWTSDWIDSETREKLKKSGIAPPHKVNANEFSLLFRDNRTISCPYCNSDNTKKTSEFGSTLCKALYFCDGCDQPFEYFKCF